MSFIAVIGLLGYVSDRAVRALATRFTPWAVETRADA
jgi:ABC-type nitrate/sulfonate/bicarbonate transport system permease component